MGTYDITPRVMSDLQYRLSELEDDLQRVRTRLQHMVRELDTLTTCLDSVEARLFVVGDVLTEARHRLQDLLELDSSGGDTGG